MRIARFGVGAFIACTMVSAVWADGAQPSGATKAQADVATLLFGDPQWAKAPVGSTLSYAYSKKTNLAALGAPFDDHIVLKLDAGDNADSRSSEVKMFSGANAKPAGPFRSGKQNPVLLLMMEENVQELSKLFSANPLYLKKAIRKAWRDDAKIVDTPIEVDGKSVDGTKITISPFADDPQKDRMLGLESLIYTVEISGSVPGNIAEIDIQTPPGAAASFSEVLKYQGSKG